MNIYYFGNNTLEEYRDSIPNNLLYYQKGKLDFVKAKDFLKYIGISVPNFELKVSAKNPSESDYENIKIFYLAFKELKDNQATEEKLWVGLCHLEQFQSYLKYRWNCETEKNVLDRYFFGESSRSIFYNGLARLWWYGRMTYDEKAKDPFELTKYICENMTVKGLLPMTLSWSHNKQLYQVYIRTLMKFEKKHKLSMDDHEKIRTRLNRWGGKVLLDSLSEEELSNKIINYLNKLKGLK